MPAIKTVSLNKLKKGQSAIIDSFKDENLALKLMEMGCLMGTEIQLTNIAPMGDPIAIMVNDYQLAIRKSEAKSVIVKPI